MKLTSTKKNNVLLNVSVIVLLQKDSPQSFSGNRNHVIIVFFRSGLKGQNYLIQRLVIKVN